jgi:zinc transport system permease protein
MFDPIIAAADQLIQQFCAQFAFGTFMSFPFNVKGLLAVIFVCLICGAMGALIVGNRMAFFSDALAHCAFAGLAIGVIISLILQITDPAVFHERIVEVMVLFGIGIGVLIAFVRERTGLASDTVIGVFYAAAIGLGAVVTRLVSNRQVVRLEQFIFGDPVLAPTGQVLCLGLLAIGVGVFLFFWYNHLILASASSSLALSRRVHVRFCHYILIVVLALMVNLSLHIVGALLINGMLIVPAAAAANLARNLRQMFWYSMVLALISGIGGYFLSWEVSVRRDPGIGTAGAIVVLAVLLFAGSMLFGRWMRERPPAATDTV